MVGDNDHFAECGNVLQLLVIYFIGYIEMVEYGIDEIKSDFRVFT